MGLHKRPINLEERAWLYHRRVIDNNIDFTKVRKNGIDRRLHAPPITDITVEAPGLPLVEFDRRDCVLAWRQLSPQNRQMRARLSKPDADFPPKSLSSPCDYCHTAIYAQLGKYVGH
jgi:hypothetical protein